MARRQLPAARSHVRLHGWLVPSRPSGRAYRVRPPGRRGRVGEADASAHWARPVPGRGFDSRGWSAASERLASHGSHLGYSDLRAPRSRIVVVVWLLGAMAYGTSCRDSDSKPQPPGVTFFADADSANASLPWLLHVPSSAVDVAVASPPATCGSQEDASVHFKLAEPWPGRHFRAWLAARLRSHAWRPLEYDLQAPTVATGDPEDPQKWWPTGGPGRRRMWTQWWVHSDEGTLCVQMLYGSTQEAGSEGGIVLLTHYRPSAVLQRLRERYTTVHGDPLRTEDGASKGANTYKE